MENSATASIVIIGDEILKGQTQDTNSYFLCQQLYECGVEVKKISAIPDDVNVIAEEISLLSRNNTHVLTSGGVGPTHDDVTYEGIAKAFGEELVVNNELVNIYCQLGCSKEEATQLSLVPKSASIHRTTYKNKMFEPIVSVKNVFAFPGIPSYLRCMFLSLKHYFSCKTVFYRIKIYLHIPEFDIVDSLNKAVKEFSPEVIFGSYPVVGKSTFHVKLSLESKSENMLHQAEGYLRGILPDNITVSPVDISSKAAADELYNIAQSDLSHDTKYVSNLKQSIEAIEKCLKTYGPNNVCLSFNGGKDCTVLLHLINCVYIKNNIEVKLKIIYVHSDESFPEIDAFLKLCIKRYNLEVIQYDYPIIDALSKLKKDHSYIKAILIGTRHTDPHANELQVFQMTDTDWPQFMRVSPLLHWSYKDVWQFLRQLNLPYCSLYDKGYTSLGCRTTTVPNPKLKMTTKNGVSFYGPAFLLEDHDEERNGRV